MIPDSETIFVVASLEFLHVSGEVTLSLLEAETDVAPRFLWHAPKFRDGIIAKFNPVAHS